jgi:CRP-like cAMP-binding protein
MATAVDPAEEDFLLALRAMALQPALQDSELQLLAQMAWRWQLGAGETLYGEGDQVAAAFLMGNGILRLECATPDGPGMPIGALKQGDWGGELAFAGGGVHGTSAVAATDVSLFAFDMARLRQLIQVQPGLYVRLLAVLALQQARQRNSQLRVDQFCQIALPRPVESPQESSAPTGLGRLLSKLTGSKEEP